MPSVLVASKLHRGGADEDLASSKISDVLYNLPLFCFTYRKSAFLTGESASD
jgi:hypothetical protein